MRVLHLAPHPDDEILGAGATLLALTGAGHDVTNLAVSLGRRDQREERRGELEDACRELALPLEVLEPPLGISGADGDDLGEAEDRLVRALSDRLGRLDLLIAPAPHDAHPGHAVVGRAAARAIVDTGGPRLWLWSLWSSLPMATTITPFREAELHRLAQALRLHRSQLERNDFTRLLEARAVAAAVIAPELVLGYGSPALEPPFAELTIEVVPSGDRMLLGASRCLDPVAPFPPPTEIDAAVWLRSPSAAVVLAAP